VDFQFILHSLASQAPLTGAVTADFLANVAAACTIQLNRDFARHWGGSYNVRTGVNILPGEDDYSILDTLPDAGAVAEHADDSSGKPILSLSLSMCSSLDDVSVGCSHEFGETGADPGCNRWADDNNGSLFAIEPFDPIEAGRYTISVPVGTNGVVNIAVSDFVLPAFFDPGAPGPYTFSETMGAAPLITAPFQTGPGGYQIKRSSDGVIVQVNGMLSPYRIEKIKHAMGRARKRGFDYMKHKVVDMDGKERSLVIPSFGK
jgi:hypothetical protein